MKSFDGFEYYTRTAPDRLLVDSELGKITYGQAAVQVNRLLNGFKALGLTREDHVGIIARNRIETVLLLLASQKGGPVFVPINNRLAPPEMAWILGNADCTALFAEQPYIEALAGQLPDDIPAARRFSFDGAEEGWLGFADWLDAQSDAEVPNTSKDDDELMQIYTSGTTGMPKGVMLTEKNAQYCCNTTGTTFDFMADPGDRLYLALPLFHVGGVFGVHLTFNRGATFVMRRDFNPVELEEMMATGDINRAGMVPAMIQACLMVGGDTQRDFSNFKSIVYGASPIGSEVLKAAAARYQCDFGQVYGMSETYGLSCCLTAADHRRALSNEGAHLIAAAGRPAAGTTITIRDEDGNAVPVGATGEICIASDGVMKGYWKRPDATEESIVNGEMRTGDAGRFDAEGYLYIVDRLKDIIVTGGENVSSVEVEEVLMRHPAIAEAAVVGVPDEKWGEAIKAIIPTNADVGDEEVIAYCREHLGGFKVPKSIDRIDALPRNGTGKVLKVKLREPYWEGIERRVG